MTVVPVLSQPHERCLLVDKTQKISYLFRGVIFLSRLLSRALRLVDPLRSSSTQALEGKLSGLVIMEESSEQQQMPRPEGAVPV